MNKVVSQGMDVSGAGAAQAEPVARFSRAWVFKPNCSMTPKQLAWLYLSIVFVTLGISTGFCMFGLWMVLPFAGLELLIVAVAFLVYARHAGDYEQIVLNGRELSITVMNGSRVSTVNLNPCWTRVSLSGQSKPLLKLESGDSSVLFGRFVDEVSRQRLLYELRRAIAAAAA
jgi:uncharacterized membrane protein